MWDDIDELVDQVTWQFYITRKVAGSALLRKSMPVVPVTDDVDYHFQDHPEWWQDHVQL